jgi:hypothetical protein
MMGLWSLGMLPRRREGWLRVGFRGFRLRGSVVASEGYGDGCDEALDYRC